jgi:hypothetical protein
MRISRFSLFITLLCMAFATACSEDKTPSADNLSTDGLPEVKLDIKRYELIMDSISQGLLKNENCHTLVRKYISGEEAIIFANWWLRAERGITPEDIDSLFRANPEKLERDLATDICYLASNEGNRIIHDTLLAYLPQDWKLEERLTPLFRRFKHFFPDQKIPRIRTAIAGHDPRAGAENFYPADELLLSDEWLFLGVDYFAGSKFPIVHPHIPRYIRKRFDDQYLEVRIARALSPLVQPELPQNPPQNLLAYMVHEGMKYYMVERLLPNVPDSTRMLWSAQQMAWAQKHEAEVFKMMLPDLYSAKYSDLSFLLEERPFAKSGWDRDAPPRLGHYIGWRIVQKYMETHPEVQMRDLFKRTDWQKILQESGYKPLGSAS